MVKTIKLNIFRKMPKMLNQYILCEDVSENIEKTNSGFELKSNDNFKKLLVKHVFNGSNVEVGNVVLVPIASGQKDPTQENGIIIRESEIIYIV